MTPMPLNHVSQSGHLTDVDASPLPKPRVWRSLRQLWCRHPHTVITPKTADMPAHVVCESCGWREPVIASTPRGTRTWDSSRDERRYEREKERRSVAEEQRRIAIARLSPEAPARRSDVSEATSSPSR